MITREMEIAKRFLKVMRAMKTKSEDSLLAEDIFITYAEAEAGQLTSDFGDLVDAGVVKRVEKRETLSPQGTNTLSRPASAPGRESPSSFSAAPMRIRRRWEVLKKTLAKQGIDSWYWRQAKDIKRGLNGRDCPEAGWERICRGSVDEELRLIRACPGRKPATR